MSDEYTSPQQLSDAQLDSALNGLAMHPLPSGLFASIMAEIQPAFVPEPFRLRVTDVVMAALITAVFVIGIVLGLDWLGFTQWLPFSAELPQLSWLTPSTLIALAVASVELLFIYLFSEAFLETA